MNVTTIGMDLAKNTFSVCGRNAHGKALFRKSLQRLHEGLAQDRTAQVNRLRGLLSEFGIIMSQGFGEARRAIPDILDNEHNALPALARRLLRDAYGHLEQLHQQVLAYDREIEAIARLNENTKRLTAIPGIGPVTATALIATVGDFKQFKNGRQFAAWLGLTPRQFTTGGKTRLGRITKQGDIYLRTLLIHGARAVVARREQKEDAVGEWIKALVNRAGFKRTAVALAAKQARVIWALMTKDAEYTTMM